jgi:hypothetical protein
VLQRRWVEPDLFQHQLFLPDDYARFLGPAVRHAPAYPESGAYKTAGIDFQLDWGIDLASLGLGDGALDINTAIGWLDKFDVQTLPGDVFYHYAGTVGSPSGFAPGSLPTWKAVTTLAWSNKALSLGLRWRFLDKMASSSKATNPSTTTPGVPSYNLFDLFGSISVGKEWSMRYGVNNLFNKAPRAQRSHRHDRGKHVRCFGPDFLPRGGRQVLTSILFPLQSPRKQGIVLMRKSLCTGLAGAFLALSALATGTAPAFGQAMSGRQLEDRPRLSVSYYKTPPGKQDEWLALYLKWHRPIMDYQIQQGVTTSSTVYANAGHSLAPQWDFMIINISPPRPRPGN